MGALIEESMVQSLVLEIAIVASSAALNSFVLVGNDNLVMARSWWFRLPSDLFLGFSAVAVPVSEGSFPTAFWGGGAVERL